LCRIRLQSDQFKWNHYNRRQVEFSICNHQSKESSW
jgi:hypothetical protein